MTLNNVEIIVVNLPKKLPAAREGTKLSCETPNPNAPPSDFWRRMDPKSNIAKIILINKTKFSIRAIYSNFSLYQ